jgi:hypothetical protein
VEGLHEMEGFGEGSGDSLDRDEHGTKVSLSPVNSTLVRRV